MWRHGDWITITGRCSVVVHGRSDATLHRHGIRMGSADIYQVVERLDEIAEALVVGVERPDAEYWIPLFVVLSPGHELDDALLARLRKAIRDGASPRHVPDEGGDPLQVMDAGAVDNPDALRWFAAYQAPASSR